MTIPEAIEWADKNPACFGFTYNSPVPLLVLPSEWFDPAWVHGVEFCAFFKKSKTDVEKVTFASFGGGAFTYHWHNCWDAKGEDGKG